MRSLTENTDIVPGAESEPTTKAEQRILDAACELMTTKSASQITGRELAKKASVNYGLIHHYFGGKNNAFREAFRQLASRYVDDARSGQEHDWILNMGRLPQNADLWKVLAHAAMDQPSLEILGWDYPLIRARLQERATSDGTTMSAAKTTMSEAFCLALGWTAFRPFIQEALGLTGTDIDQVGESIVERIDTLW